MNPLTVTLWDFTWYARTGPGQPFQERPAGVPVTVNYARERS